VSFPASALFWLDKALAGTWVSAKIMIVALWCCTPSLCMPIAIVVLHGSEPQVIGANTRRDIARMADKKTFGYWAVSKFIGNSVRPARLTLYLENAIPLPVLCRSPQPAGFGAIDL
jgi:hypothetical protein